jgi:Ca-activated chloride channel family protein
MLQKPLCYHALVFGVALAFSAGLMAVRSAESTLLAVHAASLIQQTDGKPAAQPPTATRSDQQSQPGQPAPASQKPDTAKPAEEKSAQSDKGEKTSPPPVSQSSSVGQIPDKDGVVRTQRTELVNLNVTVTDAYSRLVTGLDKEHFEVFEDKVRQTIQFFKDDDVPVSLGIVFDVSGSMKGKLDRARDALRAFVDTSHQEDDFFLVGFNHRANLVAEFTDGSTLQNKLTLIDPKGQTALYDAAYLGIEKVRQGRHDKHAILLISDGQDNSSRYTYGELRKLLKEANVQIYCIGIVEMGGGAGGTLDMQGQSILEEISQTTGGKAFFPRSAAELEDAVTRIALELRHQYSIAYEPTNADRNGRWRKINIKVKPPRGFPNLTVRSREGYYALK